MSKSEMIFMYCNATVSVTEYALLRVVKCSTTINMHVASTAVVF